MMITRILISAICGWAFDVNAEILTLHGKPFLDLGEERELLDPRWGLDYFPDEGTVVLPGSNGSVNLLLAGGISTWLVEGGDASTFTGFSAGTMVMGPVTGSSWENGYAGMSGAWLNRSGRLFGVYHAEDQVDLPLIPGTQIPGFYASVGMAVSDDGGRNWKQRRRLITASQAKLSGPTAHADQGAAEPGVVPSPDGKWLYVTYTDHSRVNGAPVFTALTRMPITQDTVQWDSCKKWDGTSFATPCLGGAGAVVFTGSTVLPGAGDAQEGHPVWSPRLSRYIMPIGIWEYGNAVGFGNSGIWLALSKDMIHWTDSLRLIKDYPLPFAGKSMRWEVSIAWTDEPQGKGWFLYGKTNKWPDGTGGQGAHLAGMPFQLLVSASDFTTALNPGRKAGNQVAGAGRGAEHRDVKGRLLHRVRRGR